MPTWKPLSAGERPTIWWQLLAYALVTAGEVLISVTSLSFFYTQAPTKMKSVVMSIKMFATSLGNGVVALVNFLIMNDDEAPSSRARHFLFFVGLLVLNGLIFIPVAMKYK